jgi:penicillin amidase
MASNDPNPLTGDWELPTRYHRIVDLIKAKNIHSFDDMKTMQGDTLSLAATPLLDLFKSSQSSHPSSAKAMEIARNFDGDMKVNSAGALIFNAWADQLTRNLFSRLSYLFTENYGSRNYPYLTKCKIPIAHGVTIPKRRVWNLARNQPTLLLIRRWITSAKSMAIILSPGLGGRHILPSLNIAHLAKSPC